MNAISMTKDDDCSDPSSQASRDVPFPDTPTLAEHLDFSRELTAKEPSNPECSSSAQIGGSTQNQLPDHAAKPEDTLRPQNNQYSNHSGAGTPEDVPLDHIIKEEGVSQSSGPPPAEVCTPDAIKAEGGNFSALLPNTKNGRQSTPQISGEVLEGIIRCWSEYRDKTDNNSLKKKCELLHPFKKLGRRKINELGIKVGARQWSSVLRYDPSYGYGDKRMHGNGGHNRVPYSIQDQIGLLVQESAIGMRNGKWIVPGLKTDLCLNIRYKLNLGKVKNQTILKYLPKNCAFGRRETDKCPLCLEKTDREGSEAPGWQHAMLKNLTDEDALMLLNRHKELSRYRRNKFNEDVQDAETKGSDHFVFNFDWASPVKPTSQVGTSYEFFSTTMLVNILGAHMFAPHAPKGGIFFHGVGQPPSLYKKTAAATLHAVMSMLRLVLGKLTSGVDIDATLPKRITLWFDTASHFRNHLLIATLPNRLLREFDFLDSVRVAYHCEYHGKTSLDGSFALARRWIANRIDRVNDLAKKEASIVEAFTHAYQDITRSKQKFIVTPLEFIPDPKEKWLKFNPRPKLGSISDILQLRSGETQFKDHIGGSFNFGGIFPGVMEHVLTPEEVGQPVGFKHRYEGESGAMRLEKKFPDDAGSSTALVRNTKITQANQTPLPSREGDALRDAQVGNRLQILRSQRKDKKKRDGKNTHGPMKTSFLKRQAK